MLYIRQYEYLVYEFHMIYYTNLIKSNIQRFDKNSENFQGQTLALTIQLMKCGRLFK